MMAKRCFLLFVVFYAGFFTSCRTGGGLAPLPGQLQVRIIFLNKDIPPNTEGVYLFAAPRFPPHAINELFMSPNSLPLDNDTVFTQIDLPYGTYEAIGLWWFNKDTQSNLADVFTLNLGHDLMPVQYEITPEQPVVSTTMYANLDRVERDAFIKGRITFNGPFPENTLATAVAAFVQKPEEAADYFVYLKSMDFTVNSNPYHYVLPVPSRLTYRYIGVFWLAERSGLDSFVLLGYYKNPENPEEPGMVNPRKGETVTGIDIHADWSNIIK